MLAVVLAFLIVGIAALLAYRQYRRRKTEAFLRLMHDASADGRWVEIITQAHKTMPADEVQKLEQAIYMHANGCKKAQSERPPACHNKHS
jgi:hypothetical protein